jgi:hypothetical protein
MKRRQTMHFTKLLCFAILAAGCGNGAAPRDYNPPLVELNGLIRSSSVSTPPDVRVALVWKVFSSNAILNVARELSVHAQFPIQFRLDVTDLPPKEALRPIYASLPGPPIPNVSAAEGTLVVYEDLNGNGVLDLIPPNSSTPSPDRVLGIPAGMDIEYIEGTIPPANGSDPVPSGFDILQYYAGPNNIEYFKRLPISTEIDIDLTADPRLTRAICDWQNPDACLPPGTPGAPDLCIPPGAKITCMADGSFTYEICSPLGSLCDQPCSHAGYGPPPSPRPANWPCP